MKALHAVHTCSSWFFTLPVPDASVEKEEEEELRLAGVRGTNVPSLPLAVCVVLLILGYLYLYICVFIFVCTDLSQLVSSAVSVKSGDREVARAITASVNVVIDPRQDFLDAKRRLM